MKIIDHFESKEVLDFLNSIDEITVVHIDTKDNEIIPIESLHTSNSKLKYDIKNVFVLIAKKGLFYKNPMFAASLDSFLSHQRRLINEIISLNIECDLIDYSLY
jgi:hypothetical protein